MSENNTTNALFNVTMPDSVDNALQNLTDKPTQSIGQTISDIWYIVFGGISNYAEKKKIKYAHSLEQFQQELASSVSNIPPEKQLEPSLQTTAQALENSKYCLEEKELRDMFTSLISNSMNVDFSKDVHPSFAEIIKQMSPLDAEIIKIFKNSPTNGFPLCRYEITENVGYRILLENVFLRHSQTDLSTVSLSISSLVRLGLLKTTYEDYLLGKDLYSAFTKHPWFNMLQQNFPDKTVSIQKGIVLLTPLGRSFTRVCIPD
ncbi:MAG: DUF4393 domain-containing protein [Lachnospiraceae bacterium]|nr:DUF4393 domain-containing protein [Lachnospiraceae bacterium]